MRNDKLNWEVFDVLVVVVFSALLPVLAGAGVGGGSLKYVSTSTESLITSYPPPSGGPGREHSDV